MSQIQWNTRTINLQAVLFGSGAGCTGGCAGVGGCICPLGTGDLQLATSWQNSEPLVRLELRTWDTHRPQVSYGVQTCHPHSTQCITQCPYSIFLLLLLSLSVSTNKHRLTILPPGEAGGRYAAGLTHQSDETSFNHSQRRDLLWAADTGRNCNDDRTPKGGAHVSFKLQYMLVHFTEAESESSKT